MNKTRAWSELKPSANNGFKNASKGADLTNLTHEEDTERMKTPTIQPEALGFTQKLARAESEIARLAAQKKQVTLQLQTNQAELQALIAQTAAHDLQKRTIQDTVNARRSAFKEAEAQAAISEGTLSKQPDVKNLENLLKQSQQEHMVILDRIGKEELAQERRRLKLTEAIDRDGQTLIRLAENTEAMKAAKARIWAEYGQAEYDAHLQKLHALQNAVSTAEQALQQAKEEIDSYARKATVRLQDWPEQQRQFTSQLTYEDSLTHILEQEIQLINSVLSEGRGTEIDINVARAAKQPWSDLTGLLSIDQHYLRSALALHGSPELLEERKAQIEAILAAHRAWKQGAK